MTSVVKRGLISIKIISKHQYSPDGTAIRKKSDLVWSKSIVPFNEKPRVAALHPATEVHSYLEKNAWEDKKSSIQCVR